MATLNVKVVPGAKADRMVRRYGDGIKMQVSAPPADGKANLAVIRVLAEALGVKPANVHILRGQSQPRKIVSIDGLDDASLSRWVESLGQ